MPSGPLATLILAIALSLACNRASEVNIAKIIQDSNQLVFAVEHYFPTSVTNQAGREVKGLYLDGLRVITPGEGLKPGDKKVFVVEDPIVRGLLRSRYLELKNAKSGNISSPIYFTSYESGTIYNLKTNLEVGSLQEVHFGHLKIRVEAKAWSFK